MTEYFFISSPLSCLKVCIKANKLYSISRVNKNIKLQNSKPALKILDKNLSYVVSPQGIIKKQKLSSVAQLVKQQLKNYFKGELKAFDVPLFNRGTDFQKAVWKSIQKIPYGQTKTYGQLAVQIKKPKASRALGTCCAKNPFLIVLPCHRVLSQKGLGGFALGLKAKKYLLSLENSY